MKKIFSVVLFSLWGSLVSFAEQDQLSVTPLTIQSNGSASLEVHLKQSGDYVYVGAQFDLYVPSWMSLYENEDEEYEYDAGDVLPKKSSGALWHVVNIYPKTQNPKDGYNHYQCAFYDTKSHPFVGSGSFISLKVETKDAPVGVFPIYIEPSHLSVSGVESYEVNSTSYVVVGDAKNASLVVSNQLPSNVVSLLNNQTAITTLDLSECTAINGDFNLVDKRGVVLPTEGLDANVSYTRSTNTWGTICLPFDVKNSETVKYYTLSAVSVAEGKMTFESVEDNVDIPAGTPVVYKSSKGAFNLSADKLSGAPASSVYTDGFTPKGTFVNTIGTGLYIANNQFWSGTEFTVPAFRTYFEGDPIKGASYRIVVDDEVAGISELEMDENGNLHEVYNLQGQHIAAPINGQVNIIDGKKAIMK